eukprot:4506436-Amphidinium_carterae.1
MPDVNRSACYHVGTRAPCPGVHSGGALPALLRWNLTPRSTPHHHLQGVASDGTHDGDSMWALQQKSLPAPGDCFQRASLLT